MNSSISTAFADAEVSMTGKVFRANGEVEEFEGNTTEVELPKHLVEEYKALSKRMKEIEAEFIKIMTGS